MLTDLGRYTGSACIAPLCVEAQHYYQAHSIPTKVKACGAKTADEIMALAGIDAFTTMPHDLAALAKESYDPLGALPDMFAARIDSPKSQEKISYINDEAKYRIEFAKEGDGLPQYKLMQVCTVLTVIEIGVEVLIWGRQWQFSVTIKIKEST